MLIRTNPSSKRLNPDPENGRETMLSELPVTAE